VAAVTCLWLSVFGTRPITVVLIRDKSAIGYDLALVTTDATASPAQVIQRRRQMEHRGGDTRYEADLRR
jgi:hypothetical protein